MESSRVNRYLSSSMMIANSYGYSRCSILGNGIVSRTCSSPQIQATARSIPIPKPSVGHAAKLTQVEIPLERLFRQAMFVNALQQQFVRGHTLRAANDFAVSLGRKHVDTQCKFRPLRVRLHVKRLHLRGIAMHHHRLIELRRKIGFIGRAQVAAPFKL